MSVRHAVLGWVVSGFLSYGIAMAWFEARYPTPCSQRSQHVGFAAGMAAMGPFGLVAGVFCTNLVEEGLMYRRPCP